MLRKLFGMIGLFVVASCGSGGGSASVSMPPLIAAPIVGASLNPTERPTTVPTSVATSVATTIPSVQANGEPTTVPTTVPTSVATTVATTVPVVAAIELPAPNGTPPPTAFDTKWGIELAQSQACSTDFSAALALHAQIIRVQFLPALQPMSCYVALYAAARKAHLNIAWITPGVNLNWPVDDAGYAQTMASAARSFAGSIWEIMNEPDVVQPQLNADWPDEQLAVNEYVALAQATAEAIHAADGTAIVVSGGPSGIEASDRGLPWLHATANLAPLIDGVGFHPYAGYDSSEFSDVKRIFNKPVYITEWETSNGGTIEAMFQAFNGQVPVFNYCGLPCAASAAVPIFP